jgi:hypothetical protein
MQRYFAMLPGVLTAVLACSSAAWCQEIVPAPIPVPRQTAITRHSVPVEAPAAPPKSHGSVHAANEKLVHELIAILKKTKSQDTFLVTVRALEDIGPRSRAAVPAIILNAERLGLLKDILQQAEDEEKDGPGIIIAEAIEHIVAPRRDREAARPGATINYPPAPPVLPPPCVVSPLRSPAGLTPSIDLQPQKTARK